MPEVPIWRAEWQGAVAPRGQASQAVRHCPSLLGLIGHCFMQILSSSTHHIRRPAVTGALLCLSVAFGAMAMTDFDRPQAALEIRGADLLSFAGLVPGDKAPIQMIEMRATGAVAYRVSAEWDGSEALASVMEVTLTDAAGEVLYRGGLSDMVVADEREMEDGQIETIRVVAQLPLSAGNDIQGSALTTRIVVSAIGIGG